MRVLTGVTVPLSMFATQIVRPPGATAMAQGPDRRPSETGRSARPVASRIRLIVPDSTLATYATGAGRLAATGAADGRGGRGQGREQRGQGTNRPRRFLLLSERGDMDAGTAGGVIGRAGGRGMLPPGHGGGPVTISAADTSAKAQYLIMR